MITALPPRCGRIASLVIAAIALPPANRWADPPVTYPADPFADHYVAPIARELGTTAGQLRVMGSSGGFVNGGIQWVFQGTIEQMTFSTLGLRITGVATTLDITGNGDRLLAGRVGPSLHLLPYRRVDLSIFFEGGPGLIDAFRDTQAKSPILTGGITLELSLSSYWFIHIEGNLNWGVHEREGVARDYFSLGGLAGLGIQL